jgi:hypothetical protein
MSDWGGTNSVIESLTAGSVSFRDINIGSIKLILLVLTLKCLVLLGNESSKRSGQL